jgi:hypothetical protein
VRAARARKVGRGARAAFAAAVCLVAFLPQSHELRYWLFVPVSLAVAAALGLARDVPRPARVTRTALVLGAAFVLFMTRPFELDTRTPAELAPRHAVAFWQSQRANPQPEPVRVCDVNPEGIFWSGPTFREFRVVACFGE